MESEWVRTRIWCSFPFSCLGIGCECGMVYGPVCVGVCLCAYVHMRVPAWVHMSAYMRACVRMCVRVYVRTCVGEPRYKTGPGSNPGSTQWMGSRHLFDPQGGRDQTHEPTVRGGGSGFPRGPKIRGRKKHFTLPGARPKCVR